MLCRAGLAPSGEPDRPGAAALEGGVEEGAPLGVHGAMAAQRLRPHVGVDRRCRRGAETLPLDEAGRGYAGGHGGGGLAGRAAQLRRETAGTSTCRSMRSRRGPEMRAAEAVVVGDPLNEATGIGPVIRQAPFDSRYTSGKR